MSLKSGLPKRPRDEQVHLQESSSLAPSAEMGGGLGETLRQLIGRGMMEVGFGERRKLASALQLTLAES